MKTLMVKLKQHTPLIHFQHDQYGATLRASEVKPRLDKYLIENCNLNNFDFWKEYLIGNIGLSEQQLKSDDNKRYKENCELKIKEKFCNGFRALDYKMRIKLLGNSKQLDWDNYPMYFGNQGNTDCKYGVFCDKDILLEFSSDHEGLLRIIENNLSSFLSKTNFGSRQTKGYGCFYLSGEERPQGADYFFTIKANNMETALEYLADFYNVLRAGINNGGLYVKSALFKYLKEKDIQWDKKTIKEEYYSAETKNAELDRHKNESPLQKEALLFTIPGTRTIYKELLGLSTSELWASEGKILTRTHKWIKRFKSPILFKPIIENLGGNICEMKVYIYISDIPSEMREQNFEIKWGGAGNLVMTTSNTFSPKDYLRWIYDNRNQLIDMLGFTKNKFAVERRNNIGNMFKNINKVGQ